jgi:hypothetical protein
MSLTSPTVPSWNEEALASLHERHKGDWRYRSTGWRSLMESDELAGVEMTDRMLMQLAKPYRAKDGGTDRENGSGSWMPMSEEDRKAARAILRELESAGIKFLTLRLAASQELAHDSEFELSLGEHTLGRINRRTAERASRHVKQMLADRVALFADVADLSWPPPPKAKAVEQVRSICAASRDFRVYDQDNNDLGTHASQGEAIEACTADLAAKGGGTIKLHGGASLTVNALD